MKMGEFCKKRLLSPYLVLWMIVLILSGCGRVGDVPAANFYKKTDEKLENTEYGLSENVQSVYEDAMERLTNPDTEIEEWEGDNIFDKGLQKVMKGYRRTYHAIRALAPLMCICSICVGILMIVFSTHNKKVRRLGLFGFVLGIPAAVLLFVFGVGIFNGMLLY